MRSPSDKPFQHPVGVTVVEATLVILVLLSLVSILFAGTKAWQNGSERTLCLLNLHQVQQAVRGFSNLNGHMPGEKVTELPSWIFGEDRFIQTTPVCAGGGLYRYGGDRIPWRGQLYMECSLGSDQEHSPRNLADW